MDDKDAIIATLVEALREAAAWCDECGGRGEVRGAGDRMFECHFCKKQRAALSSPSEAAGDYRKRLTDEIETSWILRLGDFRKALNGADLHGHYNIFQQHFGDIGYEEAAREHNERLRHAVLTEVYDVRRRFPKYKREAMFEEWLCDQSARAKEQK